LDLSLAITGNSKKSIRALSLKGRALMELGRIEDAVTTLKSGLFMENVSEFSQASLALIGKINAEQGVRLDIDYFDRQISQNPQDSVAYYFRGMAHLTLGNVESAVLDIEESYSIGLRLGEVRSNLGYTRLKTGGDAGELAKVIAENPRNALYNAYFGEYQVSQGNYAEALDYLENANILDPDLGLAYLIRGKLFMSQGLQEFAEEVFDSSEGLDLPTALDYIDRGEIRAFFGDYDVAFSDLNEAIRINPNQAMYYNARGKIHATTGDFNSALADFNAAIRISPSTSEYYINRGVLYHLLGESKSSLADFETADFMGNTEVPLPESRKTSYFAVFRDITLTEAGARLRVDLLAGRETLRDGK